jgi:hypothetical protein
MKISSRRLATSWFDRAAMSLRCNREIARSGR